VSEGAIRPQSNINAGLYSSLTLKHGYTKVLSKTPMLAAIWSDSWNTQDTSFVISAFLIGPSICKVLCCLSQ
jgi:hypothetical protein